MLQDLDRTIAALFQQELPTLFSANGGAGVTISFETPDSESIARMARPAVNCFLYDIRENLELRKGAYYYNIDRENGSAVPQRPQPRVDCSYLIAAWAGDGDTDSAQTEHRLLGEVIKALLRYRELPETVLQGSLRQQDPPVRALSLRPNFLGSVGEFWQAMGGKPKAALNYTITVAVDVFAPGEAVPLSQSAADIRLQPKL